MTRPWATIGCAMVLACFDSRLLEGKRCSASRPCPAPLRCDLFEEVCRSDSAPATTPCETPRQPITCALVDQAVSPSNPPNGVVQRGTRLVFAPGRYTAISLSASASAECPVVVSGAADGGTIIEETMTLAGSGWRLSDLHFAVTRQLYALRVVSGASLIEVRRISSDQTATQMQLSRNDYPFDLFFTGACSGISIVDSRFVGPRAPALFVAQSCEGPLVEGNVFETDAVGPTVQIESRRGGVVVGNDFSGRMPYGAVEFTDSNNDAGIVRRNRFHDLSATDAIVVRQAALVTHNTFERIAGTAASCGAFQNNLLQAVNVGLACGSSPRGFNLFDEVSTPLAQGPLAPTDLRVRAELESDGRLKPISPAIDAADPSSPVPRGGGARADIGAFERGAKARQNTLTCDE